VIDGIIEREHSPSSRQSLLGNNQPDVIGCFPIDHVVVIAVPFRHADAQVPGFSTSAPPEHPKKQAMSGINQDFTGLNLMVSMYKVQFQSVKYALATQCAQEFPALQCGLYPAPLSSGLLLFPARDSSKLGDDVLYSLLTDS
jgi:hypothetical protein